MLHSTSSAGALRATHVRKRPPLLPLPHGRSVWSPSTRTACKASTVEPLGRLAWALGSGWLLLPMSSLLAHPRRYHPSRGSDADRRCAASRRDPDRSSIHG